ncbi:MAG: alanine/ornithine racemase family PLP-dependent enzyme [Treponema sp.]|jgi:predicted amino acid racemase|nr:alanine/ornithine racemase family PLP-dependent enzyme [Treponema sp.]
MNVAGLRFPLLNINIEKLQCNLKILSTALRGAGCSMMIVTKSSCADSKIVEMLLSSPFVDYLADSRIQNIQTYSGRGKPTVLLRLPQVCEIEDVVRYADISMNSELDTLRLLNTEAARQDKTHKIVLMIDLGDLREGIYFEEEKKIIKTIEEIKTMQHVEFYGVGTNLTCYGAIIPKKDNLSVLTDWAARIFQKCGIKCAIVSGGNSSSYYLIEKGELPSGINNLRLGESFILGTEAAYKTRIKDTFDDAVTLDAQIVELQTKRSIPVGESGVDAFSEKPVYEDRGEILRAILAIGRQDVDPASLVPEDPCIDILGASSDHLIMDVSKSEQAYRIGSIVRFKLGYASFLRLFTSAYVNRCYE